MSFTPISNDFIQYQAQASGTSAAGFFLKLYAGGTSTPISAALDSGGSVLVAKIELDSLGYAKNSSGGATAVFIDQSYRLVLYVNATDADANTFANAVQDIDNLDPVLTLTQTGVLISFNTVALAIAASLTVGQTVRTLGRLTVNDNGGALYEVVASGTGTDDGGSFINSNPSGSFQLRLTEAKIYAEHYGAIGDNSTDNAAALTAVDALGETIHFAKGVHIVDSNITLTSALSFDEGAILKPTSGALIRINGAVDAGGYQIFDISAVTSQDITATASQTVFPLSNAYVIASGNLFVNYSDMLMDITVGYTETTTTSITTTFDVPVGVIMTFVIGGIQFGTARNDFADIPTGIACPEWWGAKGADGGLDDTSAVQACLGSGVSVKFKQRYRVSQVTIDLSERRIDFDNYALIGIATATTSSVLELKCNAATLHNIRVDAQFKTNYECGIHWYTNQLPGNVAGVFGFSPGNNRIYGMQADNAQIGLCIGALPSQGSSPQPPQNSSTELSPTAINAPLSESHVFGFSTLSCLNPLRARQGNGKVTFSGSIAIPAFGSFPTTPGTLSAIVMAAPEGMELMWKGGAIENVADTGGFLFSLAAGNIDVDGAVIESVSKSFLSGTSKLSLSNLANFGLNTNSDPWFMVQAQHTGALIFSDFKAFMPAARFGAGTEPFIKCVTDTNGSLEANDNLVVKMSNMSLQDAPWNDAGSTYMQPVLGGRILYSNCDVESIPAAGAARNILHRLDSGDSLLSNIVDTTANTIASYPQTTTTTDGGWSFTPSTASNSWGSNTDLPTAELTAFSNSIRLTSISGQSIIAVSPNISTDSATTYVLNMWVKTGTSGSLVVIRASFFKFDGSACTTANEDMLNGAESKLGSSFLPFAGVFKTPSECTQVKLSIEVQNGGDITFTNPELT